MSKDKKEFREKSEGEKALPVFSAQRKESKIMEEQLNVSIQTLFINPLAVSSATYVVKKVLPNAPKIITPAVVIPVVSALTALASNALGNNDSFVSQFVVGFLASFVHQFTKQLGGSR